MPRTTQDAGPEERDARVLRDREARAAADQLKAKKRSSSRDVKMNDRCRGSTGAGRTITSLLGLDALLPLVAGGAGNGATAGTLGDAEAHEDLLFPFEKDGLKIILSCLREEDGSGTITATFCNAREYPMTDFVFEAAVQKSVRLAMQPASGTIVPPKSERLTQAMQVKNSKAGEKPLHMRLRISYVINGTTVQESVQVDNFPPGF